MAALLRPCDPALAVLLSTGDFPKMWGAELFVFTLNDGTIYRWTNWLRSLKFGGNTYLSMNPFLSRSKWGISNKMSVPSLTVGIMSYNKGIGGGAGNLKTQIHNGLFDGALFSMTRVFMLTPGDTTTLGGVGVFGGVVSNITLDGVKADITIKGNINQLDQMVPRNVYQGGCQHAFCDTGCTLNRASFTTSYVAGATPSSIFIPWNGAAPGNYATYLYGTVTMTGGLGAGQKRTVAVADATGLTLAYPFYITPATGDAFTAFQGCTKGFNDSSGHDCTAYANTQHWRGFDQVPPPLQAV